MRHMSSSFRCIECGAVWDRHWPTCASCFRQGCVIPFSSRPRAAVDSLPGASTARALARMAWQTVEHPGVYESLKLGAGALVEVSGLPGAGKSSWACRLADAVTGPVLLVAAEEGLSPSLAARLLRCKVRRDDFHVITRATVDAAVGYARKVQAVSLVIDSVQEAAWTASELRHVLAVCDSVQLLVAVLQVTKQGLPAGAMALQHEADVCVSVESMHWTLTKSRYQDLATIGGAVLQSVPKENAA